MGRYVYECGFCGKDFKGVWRCSGCGMLTCDTCSKGGQSTGAGGAGRAVAGLYTLGITELARSAYRKAKQHCLNCGGKSLVKV